MQYKYFLKYVYKNAFTLSILPYIGILMQSTFQTMNNNNPGVITLHRNTSLSTFKNCEFANFISRPKQSGHRGKIISKHDKVDEGDTGNYNLSVSEFM